MFADLLYQPTDYDWRTGANHQRFMWTAPLSFTGLFSSVDSPIVPGNKVLLLTYLQFGGGAAAATAEVINRVRIGILGPSTSAYQAFLAWEFDGTANGIGQNRSILQRLELVLMPEQFVQFVVNKSAAVAAFDFQASLWGWLLPRGNIQTG